MARKVLIVVDMLNDFMHPEGRLYSGDKAREIVGPVVEGIREYIAEGKPVIFVHDAHEEDDEEFNLFGRHAVAGTWGGELLDEIREAIEGASGIHYLAKRRYSAFFNTNLEEMLRSFGIFDTDEDYPVELCGVETSICVMDTVGDLANRDVRSLIRTNRVADFDQEQHECSLKRMDKIYGARVVD
ncbi:MAG: cysteine hydrolase family protein [Desulfatibacillaceae bacterium]